MKASKLLIAVFIGCMLSGMLMAGNVGKGKSADKACKDCGPGDSCKTSAGEPAKINTGGLETLLQSNVPVVLLDARAGKYDDGKRIHGARAVNDQSKPEEIAKVVPSKEALVVTYCVNLKCGASHKLYQHLKQLGYSNVIEYPEGIEGWTKAGKPTDPK